jgi:hypothetical protein
VHGLSAVTARQWLGRIWPRGRRVYATSPRAQPAHRVPAIPPRRWRSWSCTASSSFRPASPRTSTSSRRRSAGCCVGPGIRIDRVITNNGSAFRSHAFRVACSSTRSSAAPTTPRPTARPSVHPVGPAGMGVRTHLPQLTAALPCRSGITSTTGTDPTTASAAERLARLGYLVMEIAS